MEAKLFDQKWKNVWTVELNESIFGLDINEWLIHRAMVYELANARKVVAHTKTRWERRGSTRKIYRQKWTGRARMWSNRSPIRKKWGVVFGPRNTVNFSISMNKKERRKALFCVLSSKLRDDNLLIVDKIKLKEIKTKEMVKVISALPYEKNILLAVSAENESVIKSASNIPYVKISEVNSLSIANLLKYQTLVLLKEDLETLDALVK